MCTFIIYDKESGCFICEINKDQFSWTAERKWAKEFPSVEEAQQAVGVSAADDTKIIEVS
jgi:hypothetical protein